MVISKENIKYSLRNLRQSKSRSLLTILSIFVGIASIFIFISFGLGLYYYVDEFSSESSANKLLIQVKGSVGAPGLDDTFKLTDDDLEAIDRVPGVFVATGSSMGVAEIQKGSEKRYVLITSYDPKKPIIWDLSNVGIFEGREISQGETKKAVLGYNFLLDDKIFSDALDLNDNFDIGGNKTKVIGFAEEVGNPQDDSNIYVTQEYFDELYPEKAGVYGWIIAEVDVKKIDKITEDIEKALRKERGLEEGKEDFFVQSFEDLLEAFSGALNIIIGFVVLIALISVIVSAVNTANTMITSVLERRKEIGIIKAVGAKNSEILKIFLFESATLGFVAGTIGVIVGYLVSSAAGSILDNLGWGFLSPHYSPALFISLVVFSTLTGAISGMFPAMRASKLNVVDALRYE
jgi:putative ABC transport system permease protein